MGTQDEVYKKICGILGERFGIEEKKLESAFFGEPLTGFHFGLTGADMVYLLFEIEKVFSIRITEEYLEGYGFSTIEKAAKSVAKVMEGSKPEMKEAVL